MKVIMFCLLAAAMLCGCGIEEGIKRNDDRYARPGAMDSPLSGIYNTYQFGLLDRYRVTHQWTQSGCGYRGIEIPKANSGVPGRSFVGRDIFEENGKTWLRFEGMKPYDFDRYVRSVKYISKERGREGEIMEVGFKALCGDTWQVTNHSFTLYLHKRDLVGWRAIWTEKSPKGKWSERRIGANVWHVQETDEQDFEPKLVGFGGPFQTWLLPIGDTGYILALKLSANQESLKYPDAHARFQAAFRHLIESVKIEPL